jgi:hypothetical protein
VILGQPTIATTAIKAIKAETASIAQSMLCKTCEGDTSGYSSKKTGECGTPAICALSPAQPGSHIWSTFTSIAILSRCQLTAAVIMSPLLKSSSPSRRHLSITVALAVGILPSKSLLPSPPPSLRCYCHQIFYFDPATVYQVGSGLMTARSLVDCTAVSTFLMTVF